MNEQNEADGGVGEFGKKFESEIDNRARRGDRARYSCQGHHAGAPGASAHQAIPMTAISARWIKQIAVNPPQPIAASDRITASAPKWTTSAPSAVNPTVAPMIGTNLKRLLRTTAWYRTEPRTRLW